MEKILIAGGAGFVGYHLLKALSKDNKYKIDVIDNLSRGKRDPELELLLDKGCIRFIEADFANLSAYQLLDTNYDYIFGLAAMVSVKNVMDNPDKTLHTNVFSILNLLEWIKDKNKNLKKLLFASTSEVYAGMFKLGETAIPTKELVTLAIDDISAPRTTYALSKMVGESACFNYSSKHKIPFIILRYHNVYGPRMGYEHVIPELLLRAKTAKKYLGVYSVTHTRAFCYITDAIEATVGLVQAKDCSGQIFNVGNSDEEITIGKLAQKIIAVVNPTLKIRPLGDQKQSPLRRCPNIDKLKEAIDFEPKISLDEGIRLTWEWYKRR